MKNTFKLLAFITIIFFSFSCIKEKPNDRKLLKFERYLDSIQTKFPNHQINSVINDELNQALEKDFKNIINNNTLSDLPLKLERAEKCNNKYILTLNHYLTDKYYKNFLIGNLEIQLYAITDEKTAKKLIKNKFYTVECTFKDFITFRNNQKYCATVLMAPFLGISNNEYEKEIQCGAIAVKLKDIKPFKKKL